MARSMVFKDAQGRPAGYLMEEEGALAYSLRIAADAPCSMVVRFEDGGSEGLIVEPPCSAAISRGEKRAAGAYVCCGGALLLYTDEASRSAFFAARSESIRQSAKKGAAGEGAAKGQDAPVQTVCPEGEERTDRIIEQTKRRWPAPPCMVCPRFVRGTWREEGEV